MPRPIAFALFVALLPGCQDTPPRSRRFETRKVAGGKEVFLRTREFPGGHWYPLVKGSPAALVELIPESLTAGPVAHVNADGTVVITDAAEASARQGWEGAGLHGYPRRKPPRPQP